MFLIILQMIGGSCVGFMGAEAGRTAFNGFTKPVQRRELTTAVRYRALVLGAIIGGGPIMTFALQDTGQFSRTFGMICLGASLVLTQIRLETCFNGKRLSNLLLERRVVICSRIGDQ